MAHASTGDAAVLQKRSAETASISGSSTSDESTRKRKRKHKNKSNADGVSKSKNAAHINGRRPSAFDHRRDSLGKAARDPRDEPHLRKKRAVSGEGEKTRSPSPVIEDDGLSRPSKHRSRYSLFPSTTLVLTNFCAGLGTRKRSKESPEEAQQRREKMCGAVRALLECIGEDPDREGLLDTPSRYAKALLFLTKGYQDNVHDVVNGAIFRENHNEMVVVKSIEIYSLCEHHMVPFMGKVRSLAAT